MARSALEAGYDVRVYARLERGLALREVRDGIEIVRAPWDWRWAVPGIRSLARRRFRRARTADRAGVVVSRGGPERGRSGLDRIPLLPGPVRRVAAIVLKFPLRPTAWAAGLGEVAEPADVWHGMWAGSLPALTTLPRSLGGATIYDSRDVYIESREFATAPRWLRTALRRLERRWAHAVTRVITVNTAYAAMLEATLRVPRPAVIMNCPDRWTPPAVRPDRIRATLGLPAATRVALYQGQLIFERGIEQAMDAILLVPDAALVLLGFGAQEDVYRAMASRPPYAGRVFVLDAVPPSELIPWTASADVSVMPIQPSTPNHRFSTPQKLFESLAAEVPVVASDLPGMSEIVAAVGAGALCDPTSAESIAAAMRDVLDAPPEARAAMRARIRDAVATRYNWSAQVGTLLDIYRFLTA